ncbi:hypothetical protein PtrV1_10270 [Pyrenophora tritici-repentis]|uniref:Uncharacterized protein n=1 Tax=Pyrenophora tritici-repentis TaxID=45151 RepID=A0A5M9L199_9PLEO|nr:hypothetical protein PtrV1_10270 [Pyrenophora tritici-repentis]KAF7567368.1 hypothetical protein PtrM4_139590 [Pyrenophora tritici-repentis]
MSDLQIGLHRHMYQHIQRATGPQPQEAWSRSSELRFQFSVATTLCHELVHVVFWWSQLRKKINLGPELGNDWEWWALGSRVPTAAKILETPEDQATTAFSLSNFCHTFQTKTGGKSYYKDCFQESTWASIRANGREAGRPIHDNLVIVSELGTDVADDDTFNTLQCEIEDYSHAQLVVQGGFEDDKIKPALYGKNKMKSNKQVVQYIDKLLRKEVEARKTKVVKAGKKGTKKTAPISTDKLTTKQEDETKMDESW